MIGSGLPKIDELRDFLRLVKREEHWGVHGRDALDICVAKASYRARVWMVVVTVAIAVMTATLLLFTYWLWQDAKTAKVTTAPAAAARHRCEVAQQQQNRA
jgi:hypothetical protein